MQYTKPQITNSASASVAIMGGKIAGFLDNPVEQTSNSPAYSADE